MDFVFTKKYRSDTIEPGLELDNFKFQQIPA